MDLLNRHGHCSDDLRDLTTCVEHGDQGRSLDGRRAIGLQVFEVGLVVLQSDFVGVNRGHNYKAVEGVLVLGELESHEIFELDSGCGGSFRGAHELGVGVVRQEELLYFGILYFLDHDVAES